MLHSGSRASLVDLARAGRRDAVVEKVAAGRDHVNSSDAYGQTCLMCFACQGDVQMVEWLLKQGANPLAISRAPGRQGMQALDYACLEQAEPSAPMSLRQNCAQVARLLIAARRYWDGFNAASSAHLARFATPHCGGDTDMAATHFEHSVKRRAEVCQPALGRKAARMT
mmetsp:Transcript_18121/g.45873  ORF Transcript_18121/g.45873 Transcript_18121/m.45873 type:complete len:169 (-) Transcript_18121:16-522(-)